MLRTHAVRPFGAVRFVASPAVRLLMHSRMQASESGMVHASSMSNAMPVAYGVSLAVKTADPLIRPLASPQRRHTTQCDADSGPLATDLLAWRVIDDVQDREKLFPKSPKCRKPSVAHFARTARVQPPVDQSQPVPLRRGFPDDHGRVAAEVAGQGLHAGESLGLLPGVLAYCEKGQT